MEVVRRLVLVPKIGINETTLVPIVDLLAHGGGDHTQHEVTHLPHDVDQRQGTQLKPFRRAGAEAEGIGSWVRKNITKYIRFSITGT